MRLVDKKSQQATMDSLRKLNALSIRVLLSTDGEVLSQSTSFFGEV